MQCNIGNKDRTIRFTVGATLLVVGLLTSHLLGTILDVVGVVLIITAAVRYCPAYTVVGITTDKIGRN